LERETTVFDRTAISNRTRLIDSLIPAHDDTSM
jgi:hypothetical protein